jgi:hypothetical protein
MAYDVTSLNQSSKSIALPPKSCSFLVIDLRSWPVKRDRKTDDNDNEDEHD